MMFSKRACAGLAAGLVMAAQPAAGQVEEGGLQAVDPFGLGFLEDGETAMPTNMWKASRTDELLPLMRQVRTRSLSPAERTLLRRVVLSPAARPDGEDAGKVLAERARIMYELGEAEAAADLMARLEEDPRGLDAETLSVDLQLALGNEQTACASLERTPPPEGVFWAKLRAVCAVLRDDTAQAELAISLAEEEGVEDDWFFDALFAALLGDAAGEDGPPARFESGLALALSAKAGLEPPVNAIASARPDLAAAMAARESLPVGVRVPAAGLAAEAGLMEADTHRDLYSRLLKLEDYEPRRAIEVAVMALDDPDARPADKARKLAQALRASAANPARFAAVARLFRADLEALAKTAPTRRHALLFARTALVAGDLAEARAWLELADSPPEPPAPEPPAQGEADASNGDAPGDTAPDVTGASDEGEAASAPEPRAPVEIDAYARAWIGALLVLADDSVAPEARAKAARHLVEAAEGKDETAQAARLFALWTAMEIAPPAAARGLMADQAKAEERGPPVWRMLALQAAAEADAAGEAVLSILALTRGDPSQLDAANIVAVLHALQAIGAEDAARTMALEAAGHWKPAGS